MAFIKSVLPPGTSFPPVVLMVLYLVAFVFSWANYGASFRPNLSLYGKDLVTAYLAFCIIGTLVYTLVSGALWLRASRYVVRSSHKVRFIIIGVGLLFFFKDFPLFLIESVTLRRYGWRNGFQGFCFIVQLCFFLFPFIVIWLAFIWFITSFLDCQWGTDTAHTHLSLDEALAQPVPLTPPPLMLHENSCSYDKDPSFLAQLGGQTLASTSHKQTTPEACQDNRRVPVGYI
ncbi:hypothetical protein C3747_216g24 [Trypanosoma cruzi]|uniref:Uncharacterized protein n=2 Tax=Trypanosoma cruzi TaxID=5693 RepID=Q4CX72_TRYCC|nr:hypothetical protein Tc00.1047053508233.25 [Trypanosoma cruzi]EAN84877.1 hypothetical protein Tc00.1047053508233.25 [Trypanosoma cruzi]PWU99635.1 hypothetical protein C3747_216g24 [Trypanosoma cruzi]RNC41196.1 putative transmembrane protein [Trypanosoma cruzi]|eukprot:XP_806728.1 hypothetical protein [Trypanosoma cruzi strain CL Brener]